MEGNQFENEGGIQHVDECPKDTSHFIFCLLYSTDLILNDGWYSKYKHFRSTSKDEQKKIVSQFAQHMDIKVDLDKEFNEKIHRDIVLSIGHNIYLAMNSDLKLHKGTFYVPGYDIIMLIAEADSHFKCVATLEMIDDNLPFVFNYNSIPYCDM